MRPAHELFEAVDLLTVLDVAQSGLGDTAPGRDDPLGDVSPVEGVGAVGPDDRAHVTGGECLPHRRVLPELCGHHGGLSSELPCGLHTGVALRVPVVAGKPGTAA